MFRYTYLISPPPQFQQLGHFRTHRLMALHRGLSLREEREKWSAAVEESVHWGAVWLHQHCAIGVRRRGVPEDSIRVRAVLPTSAANTGLEIDSEEKVHELPRKSLRWRLSSAGSRYCLRRTVSLWSRTATGGRRGDVKGSLRSTKVGGPKEMICQLDWPSITHRANLNYSTERNEDK